MPRIEVVQGVATGTTSSRGASGSRKRAVEGQVMLRVAVGVLEVVDARRLVFKLTRTGPTRVVTFIHEPVELESVGLQSIHGKTC